jgi:hypothetical protein
VSSKYRKSYITLWFVAAILFTSTNAQETKKSKPAPLTIQEQGSFAVGGTVITNPGKFDHLRPTPDGKRCTVIMLTCFIRFRRKRVSFRW